MKSRGPRMLPRRTPHFTSAFTERETDNSTICFRPGKYDDNQARAPFWLHASPVYYTRWRGQLDLTPLKNHRRFPQQNSYAQDVWDTSYRISSRKIGPKTKKLIFFQAPLIFNSKQIQDRSYWIHFCHASWR